MKKLNSFKFLKIYLMALVVFSFAFAGAKAEPGTKEWPDPNDHAFKLLNPARQQELILLRESVLKILDPQSKTKPLINFQQCINIITDVVNKLPENEKNYTCLAIGFYPIDGNRIFLNSLKLADFMNRHLSSLNYNLHKLNYVAKRNILKMFNEPDFPTVFKQIDLRDLLKWSLRIKQNALPVNPIGRRYTLASPAPTIPVTTSISPLQNSVENSDSSVSDSTSTGDISSSQEKISKDLNFDSNLNVNFNLHGDDKHNDDISDFNPLEFNPWDSDYFD